jgi:hypothetical protein
MINNELLKKNKICIYCCTNRAREGTAGCESCATLAKEKRIKLKTNPESVCVQCNQTKVRTSTVRCKKCKALNFAALGLKA